MFKLLILLFSTMILAEQSFITPLEYGERLYKNPRGIGCDKCHGEIGAEVVIVKYKHKGKPKEIIAPPINKLDYEEFSKVFSENQKRDIMPRYFLTNKEIQTLYVYIQRVNKDSNITKKINKDENTTLDEDEEVIEENNDKQTKNKKPKEEEPTIEEEVIDESVEE